MFNVAKVRQDFTILSQPVYGKDLIYFDNAATTQKPDCVVQELVDFYYNSNANIHRGVHYLSMQATDLYERARAVVQKFINAATVDEIVFCRGTTEAINLVAQSFVKPLLTLGDEILISQLEHHANIVPWYMLAKECGVNLRIIPINQQGELDLANLDELLTARTKIVAINHISNALGTINPVKLIVEKAHAKNIPVLVDGAQSAGHLKVDVQELGADFYTLSGHKLYGPTGIGALYGKYELLNQMRPYQGGGEMISSVSFTKVEYNKVPYRFEAGTPNIAGAIGLARALNYLQDLGLDNITKYEQTLLEHALKRLQEFSNLTIVGNAAERAGIISMVIDGIHPHDIATILDTMGIAIRAGHHCAMPLMEFFQVPATSRISFSFYNTTIEIDNFCAAINKVNELFL